MDNTLVMALLSQAAALQHQATLGQTSPQKLRDDLLHQVLSTMDAGEPVSPYTLARFINCGAPWAVEKYLSGRALVFDPKARNYGLNICASVIQAYHAASFEILDVLNSANLLPSDIKHRLLASEREPPTPQHLLWLDRICAPVFESVTSLMHVIGCCSAGNAETLAEILTGHARNGALGAQHVRSTLRRNDNKGLATLLLLPLPDAVFSEIPNLGKEQAKMLHLLDLRRSSHGRLRLHQSEPDLPSVLSRPLSQPFFAGLA